MWYAIQVTTGEEGQTAVFCRRRIETEILEDIFYPEIEVTKRYEGKWHKHTKPMFPGYIFVVTESVTQLYEELKKIPKLSKILGTDRTPVALSDDEVRLIQKITNKDHVAEISVGFIEGDKLIIESGPLQGMEGMVRKIDRHKRMAQITVEMFGRTVDMTLGLEVLKKN